MVVGGLIVRGGAEVSGLRGECGQFTRYPT